ncbi:hypothetical protein GCM10009718_10170 [Isoptericola halotolerans]|uniref:Lipoprotein n=1 Tax=Isoptericola halotolerans TaxID=300560 RepID=A0ABX1ZZV6_9MICO|nr:hypothetical protein [Isoptericola halotolerans]NOV96060.1 hypothetical protein [Isoptericola halotolerans]
MRGGTVVAGAVLALMVLGGCSGNMWIGYGRECEESVEAYGEALSAEAERLAAELGGGAPHEVTCDTDGGPTAWVGFDLDAPGAVDVETADARLTELGWVPESSEEEAGGYRELWYAAGDGSGMGLILTRFTTGDVRVSVHRGPPGDD